MSPDQNQPAPCGEGKGVLPSCAPLAVPYVPPQQRGQRRYSQREALSQGTLFPGLDLPFHLKTDAVQVASTPLGELQALEFVLAELGLYLDTHPDDQEAFSLFQQYAALEKEGRARYEAMCGPVSQSAAAACPRYAWTQDPWPWDLREEGEA